MINVSTMKSIKDTYSGVFIKGSLVVLRLDVSDLHFKYVEIDLNKSFPHIALSKIRKGKLDIDDPYFGYQRFSKASAIQYIADFATNDNSNQICINETLQILQQLNY